MASICKISYSRFSNYFLWGSTLTIVELFILDDISFLSFLFLIIINSFLGIIIEYYFGKHIYSSWWQDGFGHNSTTGTCILCKSWFSDNLYEAIVKRFMLSIPIILLIYIFAPFITNVNVTTQIKLFEKKIKSNKYIKSISFVSIIDQEYISGKKGNYYKIELHKATLKKKVLFQKGEYIIDNLDNNLLIPLNFFIDSVYKVIDLGYPCSLYIRGTADMLSHESFEGFFEKGFGTKEGFSEFQILRKEGNGYNPQETNRIITSPFKNGDLPDLRGRFLQKIFEDHYKNIPSPKLLEGKVSKSISSEDRNGFLIMYVDWENRNWLPNWLHQIVAVIISLIGTLAFSVDLRKWLKFLIKFN